MGKEAGVDGRSNDLNGVGVRGQSEHWFGVLGQSTRRDGVRGETNSSWLWRSRRSYWRWHRSLGTGKSCWSF